MTRDGDYEYYDRWLFAPTDDMSNLDIIVEFTGHPKEDWSEATGFIYENNTDYRHYSIYSRQEVEPEDLKVLERYGI
jgi:tRNA A37 methylthiotransferase MiaB